MPLQFNNDVALDRQPFADQFSCSTVMSKDDASASITTTKRVAIVVAQAS